MVLDGDNTHLSANLLRIAKFAVSAFADELFNGNRDYVDKHGNAKPAFKSGVKVCADLEDLLAFAVLPIFREANPEIILPDEFTSGLQLEQFTALMLREVLSSVTPALNFDSQIFASGTPALTSGRAFAVKTESQWQDLILGMGFHLLVTYLDNTTNINVDSAAAAAIYASHGWRGLLEEIVDWGVGYFGTAASGLFIGLDPAALGSVRGTFNNNAFSILSTVLNTLLPFGFLCDCVDVNGNLDAEDLFNTVYDAVEDFDLNALLGLFGRSGLESNILSTENVISQLLSLINRFLGLVLNDTTILQSTQNLETAFHQENLKLTVFGLITTLYTRRINILNNILPIAGALNARWGGEQVLGAPIVNLSTNIGAANGIINGARFIVSNGAKGVWRSYINNSGIRVQDNHYKYQITSVTCSSPLVTGIELSSIMSLDYGQSLAVTFNAATIPTNGTAARFDIHYKAYGGDGLPLANDQTFTISKYVYLSYNKTDSSTKTQTCKNNNMYMYVYSPQYIAVEDGAASIPQLIVHSFENAGTTSTNYGQVTGVTAPAAKSGITFITTAKTAVSIESKKTFSGFTVDAAAYTAANITPGTLLSWTFQTKCWYGPLQQTTGSGTMVLKFYSANALATLKGLTDRECANIRKQTEHKTGDVLADRLLVTAAQATEELRQETNFTTTGVNENGDTVTLVNGAVAWNNYVNALNNAIRAAYQPWNANAVFNHRECYEALRIAAIDLQVCKMTSAEMAAQSGAYDNDAAVEDIITTLDDIHGHKGGHKDYMLYRWHRYHKWEKKAHDLAVAYETANADVDTTVFPYISIDVDDLSTLIAGDGFENYIEALVEPLEEEQIEAAEIAKVEAITAYADYDALNISDIGDMLTATAERLLPREGGDVADYGYVRAYLETETASALAAYGNDATSAVYTEKSWNRYLDALVQAQEQLESGIENEDIVIAKNCLQKGVNGLIPITDGADYAGLEDAIISAQAALDNIGLYVNDSESIGKVIAALGYEAKGVDLFPDAARNVVKTPYAQEDQERIDDAESALRLALSNLRFAGTTLTNAKPEASTELQGTGNGAYFAYLPKNLNTNALHTYLSLENPPADVANIQPVFVNASGAYAGTGLVVTYYGGKTVGLDVLTVPVASYTVVVKGDISGDAAIDAADAALADLAFNAHSTLEGAFLKAALVDPATAASGTVTVKAFSEIMNMAVGNN